MISVYIPNSITSIEAETFMDCRSLTNVIIPNSIFQISQNAFKNCRSIKGTNIPNSVHYIGDGAFASCRAMESIIIGNSVTGIGEEAFYECTKLSSVTCLATTPPVLADENCFDDECYNSATLSVPADAADTYRNATIWERFIIIKSSDSQPADVNGDGEINIADVNSVTDIVVMGGNAGHNHTPGDGGILGDVNGDGEVTVADINTLIAIILGNN